MHQQGVVDPMLKGAGRKLGIEIWRIKDLHLEAVPKEQYGCFYSGDTYIILDTKSTSEWNVHFWLGKDATIDEWTTAAIKTVELDDSLNGLPVQYREEQDHESTLFLSYFKNGIRYMEGGTPSGLHKVENMYDNWQPRLFHCKGKRNVRCRQVKCELKSLNLGDVFLLDLGLNLYVWMPPQSGRLERIKGMAQAKSIRDVERIGRPQVHVLDSDWDTNEEFWANMGGLECVDQVKSAEEGGSDENFWRTNRQQVRLYRVKEENSNVSIKLVSQGDFQQKQLDSGDAFILDAGSGGVFVWIGKGCTKDERLKAMEWAKKFIAYEGKSEFTQVSRVLEGAEPTSFTQWASGWQDAKLRKQYEPRLFQCSDESGKLVVEEISNFTQEDLDGDDVMILDSLNIIYVWVGAGANANEKKHAKTTAQKYLETDSLPRPGKAAIETLFQGSETPTFKKLFPRWDDEMWNPEARSVENMRKLLFG